MLQEYMDEIPTFHRNKGPTSNTQSIISSEKWFGLSASIICAPIHAPYYSLDSWAQGYIYLTKDDTMMEKLSTYMVKHMGVTC